MATPTQIRPGQRLRSQACDTEVVVVRAGSEPAELRCGGAAMIAASGPAGAGPQATAALDPAHSGGTLLGKRYTTAREGGVEVLVVKPGAGSLSDGDTPLVFLAAKPLPASD